MGLHLGLQSTSALWETAASTGNEMPLPTHICNQWSNFIHIVYCRLCFQPGLEITRWLFPTRCFFFNPCLKFSYLLGNLIKTREPCHPLFCQLYATSIGPAASFRGNIYVVIIGGIRQFILQENFKSLIYKRLIFVYGRNNWKSRKRFCIKGSCHRC